MKKTIKFLIAVAIFLLIPFNTSNAEGWNLYNLDISVTINDDGSADITEVRNMDLNDKTEMYIPIGNLGDSKISNFKVYEAGVDFKDASPWDINLSREEKAGKFGVVDKGDEVELCWGIGEYGKHTYVVSYHVTNIVKQLNDGQAIYWKFVNDDINPLPESVSLTIKPADSNKDFSIDNGNKIWAFGYRGNINFSDGKIVAISTEAFDRNSKVIVLATFPDGTFNTESKLDKTLLNLENQAKEGSEYNRNDITDKSGSVVGRVLFSILNFIIPVSFAVFGIKFALDSAKIRVDSGQQATFKVRYTGEYEREVPYAGSFEDVVKILSYMGFGMKSWITAYFLKWIKEGKVESVKTEEGRIFKKETTSLKLVASESDFIGSSLSEYSLWAMVTAAAGENGILEGKEFSKWTKKNYTKFDKWQEDLLKASESEMIAGGYMEKAEKKVAFFTRKYTKLTSKGRELTDKIYRFYNYLYDFSLLNEREDIHVHIWDELMIWAGLLDIAERVRAQFEKLYPGYLTESVYGNSSIYTAYYLSSLAHTSYTSAMSSSSGGGGSSSFGGGGGSFGGGSGGGAR